MEKLLITWEDLSEEVVGAIVDAINYKSEKVVFTLISEVIQDVFSEQHRMIFTTVDDILSGGSYFITRSGKTLSKDDINDIVRMLTKPPEPKGRMVYVSWGSDWDSEYTLLFNSGSPTINYGYNYCVPESIAKEIGFFVSDWNKAREEGKLSGYEI